MQITKDSETQKGPAEWFTGDVYIDAVAAPEATSTFAAAAVHFTPGARTAWHTHPHGQTIFVTEGAGLCQREGGPSRSSVPATASSSSPAKTTGTAPPRTASWSTSPCSRTTRPAAPSPGVSTSPTSSTTAQQRHSAPRSTPMARILITGSAEGLGLAAAQTLLEDGHEIVVHARSTHRLAAVRDLLERGAKVVVGDLSDLAQTRDVAAQVNRLGPMDAVIHNAGVISGPHVLPVNVVAPYLLTALIERPRRLIYLSSSMHRAGRARLNGMDWSGPCTTGSYSDSKLFVTTLAIAVARIWPDVLSNSVDPGWVPTKMGGPGAPDDLRLGHVTQEWLATSNDPQALTSGGYWHHQRRAEPAPAVHDQGFQDDLLDALARFTASPVPQQNRRSSRGEP
jgi:NAD(P)-dependent dehydrogenase (short-subunit alcohol dehydrogenase family)